MARRTARSGPAPDPNLVRLPRWAGVRAGDPVAVDGMKIRAATWTFVAHVRNPRTGDEWVEVVGGRPGEHKLRSFPLERIFPAGGPSPGATSRQPSLSEAPQLPLG